MARPLVLDQEVADLRAVAVGDHQVVITIDEAHQELADAFGVPFVVFDGARLVLLHEGVASHGDQDDGLTVAHSTSVVISRLPCLPRQKVGQCRMARKSRPAAGADVAEPDHGE
jgi:hypothetical protein